MSELAPDGEQIAGLAARVGDADLVLLGEATHGTHEFYAARSALTRRLIAEHGFGGVAVEADAAAAARVDRYVRGAGDDSAAGALADLAGFPAWVWRNEVVVELVDWLRHDPGAGCFVGLDDVALREAMTLSGEQRTRTTVWNLRAAHMAHRLESAVRRENAPIVVWAHNVHVGDARATEMGMLSGEVSLGQLVRERDAGDARLVGFTTHAGTVTAARDWGGPAERRGLRPSLDGSVERLLHDRGADAAVLDLAGGAVGYEQLIERMVGVVYRPESELWSHYMRVCPAEQFDLLVHLDRTTALEPLDSWAIA
jgi:erythromycin esterase-like protein